VRMACAPATTGHLMNRKSIYDYIDGLGERFTGYRIRVGSGGNPPTVGVVAVDADADRIQSRFKSQTVAAVPQEELASAIEEMAADAGWPDENPTLRIHSITCDGKAGPSYANTKRTSDGTLEGSSATSIEALCQTVVRMAQIQTKTIDILTETIAHSKEMEEMSAHRWLEARQDQLAAEAESMATSLLAEAEQPESTAFQDAALTTLQQVANRLTSPPPTVTVETLIGLLEADPQLAIQLATDPRVVELVTRASVVQGPSQDETNARPPKKKAPRNVDSCRKKSGADPDPS